MGNSKFDHKNSLTRIAICALNLYWNCFSSYTPISGFVVMLLLSYFTDYISDCNIKNYWKLFIIVCSVYYCCCHWISQSFSSFCFPFKLWWKLCIADEFFIVYSILFYSVFLSVCSASKLRLYEPSSDLERRKDMKYWNAIRTKLNQIIVVCIHFSESIYISSR